MNLNDISYFLELGQLGLIANRTIFVHGDYVSDACSTIQVCTHTKKKKTTLNDVAYYVYMTYMTYRSPV